MPRLGCEEGLTAKRHKGAFCGDTSLCLDGGGGYVTAFVRPCRNAH